MTPSGAAGLDVTITSLEMRARPFDRGEPAGGRNIAIERVVEPGAVFYRSLYDAVGENWLWSDRRRWSDERLAATVDHPEVEVWVLSVDGTVAGFAELDARRRTETELAYFGLLPAFLGRGLGPELLRFAINRAWDRPIQRLWVHTCTLDHPAALGIYQRHGFVAFGERRITIEDPRLAGLIPATAAPHVPIGGCRP